MITFLGQRTPPAKKRYGRISAKKRYLLVRSVITFLRQEIVRPMTDIVYI